MKNFKKVIASLTSAAMVFGMVSLTPMSSVAAVTLPDIEGNNNQYLLCDDGNFYDYYETNYGASLPQGVSRLARIGLGPDSLTVKSVSVNKDSKTVILEDLVTTSIDFDNTEYTISFKGTSSISNYLVFENCNGKVAVESNSYFTLKSKASIGTQPDGTSLPEYDTISVNVGLNSTFKVEENAYFIAFNQSHEGSDDLTINMLNDTVADKTLTVETKDVPYSFEIGPGEISTGSTPTNGIHGPITFTNKNSSTISDDEEETTSADETDDSTTGDTTDETDDATTDDTTSGDSSDDETTTGDSSDDETESPNVIEGKNLSWNTVDSTGKSYWYENGVKQGTVDDPKAVSYDGAVRGREIYDPESKEWYWLDADSNGARAVNKEVFVPYIYQDQSKLNADEIMALSKLSDGGLDGVGGTVYSAIINKTGKWIRYNAKGAMIKGWYTVEGAEAELYPTQKGNTYYYDTKTGTMAKGDCVIDGVLYHFDGLTGALKK